jgi:hypothetical protein
MRYLNISLLELEHIILNVLKLNAHYSLDTLKLSMYLFFFKPYQI